MAEKNTLSILESIKQKMIQFDQKDSKKTSSFSGDEFAYISPEKNNLNKTTEENAAPAQENQALNKDSELDHNDQKKSAVDLADEEDHEENPFISNPLTQDNDDFLFEDDDEIVETQKKSFLQHDVPESEENKLEVDNKKKEEISKPEVEVKKEEIFSIPSKAPIENKVENQSLPKDEDDLDLDDLDLDEDEDPKPEVKKYDSQSHDLGFDEDEDFLTLEDEDEDLDIDKLEEIGPEPKIQEAVNNFDEDEDLDIDELEEFRPEPKKQEAITHFDKDDFFDIKKSEDKDFLSDIDLDSEDEVLEEKKPEPEKQEFKQMSTVSSVSNVSSISVKKDKLDQSLISEETLQQTTSSIKKLIDANNVVHGMKSFSNPNNSAFNELAVQLMEPKLEKWLNEHLSNLVEEIVREEIKKIIPRD